MTEGRISSFESMGTLDGPGIRFVVFLQGCSLRCKYCHNPETWSVDGQTQTITPEKLVEKIERFKPYFGEEGGVTFSGGEPLLQPLFLKESLTLCKEKNIHTVIDTAGCGLGKYEEILPLCDLVILDIKAVDEEEYKLITGQPMNRFFEFLSACEKHNCKMWIRQVIVPGVNDDENHAIKLADFISTLSNVEKVELLPYKGIGKNKYQKLGINYVYQDLSDMDEKRCKQLENIVVSNIKNNFAKVKV